jgi:hypothetical protein
MRDYWWIKDLIIDEDLIDTDPKAMGVYLALLYLRFWKENVTLKTKISSPDILNEDEARRLFAFYLAGKVEDTREASNAAVEFIDRLFNKGGEKILDSKMRNFVLEDIECRYYNRFTSAFEKYLRLDEIHEEFREEVKRVMRDVRNQLYPKSKSITRCGSVCYYRSNLADAIKELYRIWDEKVEGLILVERLILNLIRSGLVYHLGSGVDLIPAPCLSDEVLELSET